MLAIKLKRVGRRHQPSYRIVVNEKRSKATGRYVEDLGWYNPLLKQHEIKKERVQHWMGVGAQPTDTVYNLLVTDGVIEGTKRAVHAKSKKKEEEATAKAAPAGEIDEKASTETSAESEASSEEEKTEGDSSAGSDQEKPAEEASAQEEVKAEVSSENSADENKEA